MKGGMKFTINTDERICYKSEGKLDCGLNAINTVSGINSGLRERYKYRVYEEHPLSFVKYGDGIVFSTAVEILKTLIPDKFSGKKLYYRTIELIAVHPATLLRVLTKYLNLIDSNTDTKLEEREGIFLLLRRSGLGHFVVLAQLKTGPCIIDQQASDKPIPLEKYCSEHSSNYTSIEVLEDETYNRIVYSGSTTEEHYSSDPIARKPSFNPETDDINVQDELTGNTTLMNAILYNNNYLANMLLDDNAEPNIQNDSGFTALTFACEEGNKEIVKRLLDKGADVNVTDEDGNTPLLFLKGNLDDKEIVKMLLDKGAAVNVTDEDGNTPLHYAYMNRNKKIIKILIEAGADVNVENVDGKKPNEVDDLLTAGGKKQKEIIKRKGKKEKQKGKTKRKNKKEKGRTKKKKYLHHYTFTPLPISRI
jgi:predicted RNA-binding protein YlqC (UPF0109 family)